MPNSAFARSDEKKELRGLHDGALVSALDAIAMAKGLDRIEYIDRVLRAHVREYLEELNVVSTTLRGNPLLSESERRPLA
jgi:hypothetical protein